MLLIENLNREELIDLNRRTAERLRHLQRVEAHEKMTDFRLGDMVSFKTSDGESVEGEVERLNQKSISVRDNQGRGWRVSPQLLKKESAL